MFKTIAFLGTFVLLSLAADAQGQESEKLAADISKAMRDSLKLNNKQQDDLYAINMQLHHNKVAARKSSPDRAIVVKSLQRIENSRDSLYRIVLKENEYAEYKTKKKNLVKKH